MYPIYKRIKNMITEKKCTVCKQIKPVSEFYKDAQAGDGLYTKCKKCHATFVAAWQQKNADKCKQINKEWKNHIQKSIRSRVWHLNADILKERVHMGCFGEKETQIMVVTGAKIISKKSEITHKCVEHV